MRRLLLFFVVIVAGAAALGAVYYFQHLPGKGELQIGRTAIQIEIADNPLTQYQGLSGRESLCADCGMLFVFKKSAIQTFVMRGMKFPLDMIFIADHKIAEIWKEIPNPKAGEEPEYIQSLNVADQVLEVNAGFADYHKLKIGDAISY